MSELLKLPSSFRKGFSYVFMAFKFAGVDIFGNRQCGFFKRNGVFMVLFALLIPVLVGQVLFVYFDNGDDIMLTITAVSSTMIFTQSAVKLTIVALKRNQIREVILDIAAFWPENTNTEEYKIMTRWTRKLTKLNFYFLNFAVTACFLYEITPYLTVIYFAQYLPDEEPTYLFPYQMYYPWTISNNLQYVLSYLLQVVPTFWINGAFYTPCDVLVVVISFYISLLFRLLQKRFENTMKTIKVKWIHDQNDYKKLKEIVTAHQKLIRLSERICEVFGVLICLQITMSSILICLFGFLTVVGGGSGMMKNILAAMGLMLDIFYNALPGQLLQKMSAGMADVAYQSMWYEKDVKIKKLILIIIMRSQKSCQLSGLRYWKMNMATFSKVISSSWSYLALVNHVYRRNTS